MSRRFWLALGLGLVVASSSIWLLVQSHHRNASYLPLEKPFDTQLNGELHEEFAINRAEIYSLGLVLKKTGHDSEERKEIKCNVQAKLLRSRAVVWERTLEKVKLEASSNTDTYYGLGALDLTPGRYELVVTNLTDLSELEPLDPRLRIEVTPVALEWTMVVTGITTLLCAAGAIVGVIIFVAVGSRSLFSWLKA